MVKIQQPLIKAQHGNVEKKHQFGSGFRPAAEKRKGLRTSPVQLDPQNDHERLLKC